MAYQYPIRKEHRRIYLKRMCKQAIRNLERVITDIEKFDSIVMRYYRDEYYDTITVRNEVKELIVMLKKWINEE